MSFNPSGSYSFLPPITWDSVNPEGREFIEIFMAECPRSVISCIMSGCVSLSLFYLLHEETLLKMTEQGTDLSV